MKNNTLLKQQCLDYLSYLSWKANSLELNSIVDAIISLEQQISEIEDSDMLETILELIDNIKKRFNLSQQIDALNKEALHSVVDLFSDCILFKNDTGFKNSAFSLISSLDHLYNLINRYMCSVTDEEKAKWQTQINSYTKTVSSAQNAIWSFRVNKFEGSRLSDIHFTSEQVIDKYIAAAKYKNQADEEADAIGNAAGAFFERQKSSSNPSSENNHSKEKNDKINELIVKIREDLGEVKSNLKDVKTEVGQARNDIKEIKDILSKLTSLNEELENASNDEEIEKIEEKVINSLKKQSQFDMFDLDKLFEQCKKCNPVATHVIEFAIRFTIESFVRYVKHYEFKDKSIGNNCVIFTRVLGNAEAGQNLFNIYKASNDYVHGNAIGIVPSWEDISNIEQSIQFLKDHKIHMNKDILNDAKAAADELFAGLQDGSISVTDGKIVEIGKAKEPNSKYNVCVFFRKYPILIDVYDTKNKYALYEKGIVVKWINYKYAIEKN